MIEPGGEVARTPEQELAWSQKMAAYWLREIEQAEKDCEKWYKRGEKITQRYRDERNSASSADGDSVGMNEASRNLNLFWSNTQTLKPAIYSKSPVAICERRFLDKDPVGRAASSILERALRYEMPTSGFHETMRQCRDDYLIVGRGVPWVRYVPVLGESISLKTKGLDEAVDTNDNNIEPVKEDESLVSQEKTWESLEVDYVHWRDFLVLGRPRTWTECQTVSKRVFLSKEDLKREFPDTWEDIPLDNKEEDEAQSKRNTANQKSEDDIGQKATIYEIWCKFDKTVYWVCKGFDRLCKHVPDPLRLEAFFPCPRPILSNTTNDTLIPVPDYIQSQDQYLQINSLTRRIDVLTNACRVVGFYDASERNIQRAFTEAVEPTLIPVDQWAMYAERGGSKGMIDFIPIDLIAKTIVELIQIRTQLIQDLDRVTGVWDILRGETNPNETLGAQQLKQQNGVGRLQERQEEFARLCRDTIAIMGEIVSEHYSPETMIQVSGAMFDESLIPPADDQANPMMGHNGGPPMNPQAPALPAGMGQPGPQPAAAQPTPPMAPAAPMPPMMPPPVDPMQERIGFIMKALELLRSDKNRGFRIDIETDSTIQPDANIEKQSRIEFMKGVTEFMLASGQIAQFSPQSVPLLGKMLQFGVRGFRVGRDLESAIDEFTDSMAKQAKEMASQPPQPSPEEVKAQSEMARTQADLQGKQMELQGREKEMAHESRMKAMDEKLKMLDVAIALASASESETDAEGKVIQKVNPELKAMVEALNQQNELMAKVEKGLRQRNAPKRVERDERGRPIRVVSEEIVDEPVAPPTHPMSDLLNQVAGQMGKAPAPMNITRQHGRLGVE